MYVCKHRLQHWVSVKLMYNSIDNINNEYYSSLSTVIHRYLPGCISPCARAPESKWELVIQKNAIPKSKEESVIQNYTEPESKQESVIQKNSECQSQSRSQTTEQTAWLWSLTALGTKACMSLCGVPRQDESVAECAPHPAKLIIEGMGGVSTLQDKSD